MLAVLRVEEAACWCCSGACGSEEWGCLYRWPWPVDEKNDRAAKGLGMHNGTEETRLYRRKNRTANTAKHGVPPPLRNKPSLRWCGQSVSLSKLKIWLIFCFIFNRWYTHLQWCGPLTGEESPQLYSAFWDTLHPKPSPKHYGRTQLHKVKVL